MSVHGRGPGVGHPGRPGRRPDARGRRTVRDAAAVAHPRGPVADRGPADFLGVGIFGANATVVDSTVTDGNWSVFSISKQGYLSSIVLGYALALFAFARGETRPAWAGHLRADAAATLRAGLRYLRRTGDTLFHPDTVGGPVGLPPPDELVQRLDHRSPTFRLAARWDVAAYPAPPAELLAPVERRLTDRDPDVQRQAVRVLAAFGPTAAGAAPPPPAADAGPAPTESSG